MIRSLNFPTARPMGAWEEALRALAARVLHAASSALAGLAEGIKAPVAPREYRGEVEFHPIYNESGAPEGALYVDGRLIGRIEGIDRL